MSATAEAKIPVCISIAPQTLQALDTIAEQMQRSRSWVAARAFESFLAPQSDYKESGAAVGAQDVAGDPSPRNAAPVFPVPGAAPFHKTTDEQMATYSTTPEAAPHVRATLERNADILRRAGEHARQVAAEQQKQREATQRRTAEYLSNIGNK